MLNGSIYSKIEYFDLQVPRERIIHKLVLFYANDISTGLRGSIAAVKRRERRSRCVNAVRSGGSTVFN